MIINSETIARIFTTDGPHHAILIAYIGFTNTGGESTWKMEFEAWLYIFFPYLLCIHN